MGSSIWGGVKELDQGISKSWTQVGNLCELEECA
jgi:hypothetical protein